MQANSAYTWRWYARTVVLGLVFVCSSVCLKAVDVPIECTVLYQTPDGYFVDAGSERGLTIGSTGTVLRNGEQIAHVTVIRVTKSTSLLRVASARQQDPPRAGDSVQLVVTRDASNDSEGEEADETRDRSPTLKDSHERDDNFVPLLTPPERSVGFTAARNIFHGTLRVRQLLQVDSENLQDYSVTRLGSQGGLERIGGTPWNFGWSGDLSYRDGQALENTPDYQKLRLHLFDLAFFRRFDDRSMVRVGRFLPRELPAVGYLDGAHGELGGSR